MQNELAGENENWVSLQSLLVHSNSGWTTAFEGMLGNGGAFAIGSCA